MNGYWLQLSLVGVLVLVNAVFAGSELALVSLREGQLQRLETTSARGAALARLARDPNRFLATIQIGITLAGFLASASAAVALAAPVENLLDPLGEVARPTSIVVVTVILSYATLVVGELAPKRLAMQRAERWGLLVARPLAGLAKLTRPVIWLLSHSTNLVVRVLGGDPHSEREEITEEELRELVASQVSFSPQQRRIISGAFEIADRRLAEILKPRPEVFVLDADAPCRDALGALAASGHARAPVGRGAALDEVTGIVHIRDLLVDDDRSVGSVSYSPLVLPESALALDALREMQQRHIQMAIVINEHGGTEGIITVEDLVEELVGEIYDETDRDMLSVRRRPGGVVVVPGRFPIHDLEDLGVDVPDGDYTTVAGLVLAHLQRLPDEPGDTVEVGDWQFEVTRVGARAVTEVAISAAPTPRPGPDDHEPG
ncbi:MAG: hemolysin family protein [Acidimicrobiales bacterium]